VESGDQSVLPPAHQPPAAPEIAGPRGKRDRSGKDPPHQSPQRHVPRFGRFDPLQRLPHEARLREVPVREARPDHRLAPELGSEPGQRPVSGGEVAARGGRDEPELLARRRDAAGGQLEFDHPGGKLDDLETQAHELQHLGGVERGSRGADRLFAPSCPLEPETERQLSESLPPDQERRE